MQYNNFKNKLGRKDFNVANQAQAYWNLWSWILDRHENEKSISNKEFINWTKEENIYHYNSENSKQIDRFQIVTKIFENAKIFRLQRESNCNKDNVDYKLVTLGNWSKALKCKTANQLVMLFFNSFEVKDGYKPFKEMLNFLDLNKSNGILFKKVIYALHVYDGNESFQSLYDCEDIIEKIITDYWNEKLNNIPNFDSRIKLTKFFEYKKLSSDTADIIKKIFNDWGSISIKDIQDLYDATRKNSFPYKFMLFTRKKFDVKHSYSEMKKIDKKAFAKLVIYGKYESNFVKEFGELIKKWLVDAELVSKENFSKARFINLDKLHRENSDWIMLFPNENEAYPFKYEEVLQFLNKISINCYKDKNEKTNGYLPNSAWAEYLVNLAFAYILNIEPKDFTKYCRTKVNEKLLPTFTAPGRGADFEYLDGNKNVIVETTIHDNPNSIIKNEVFSVKEHIKNVLQNNKSIKVECNFVSFLKDDNDKNKFLNHVAIEISNEMKDRYKIKFLEFNFLNHT